MIALMENTSKSWVAKHQLLVKKVPGIYAIAVKGVGLQTEEDPEMMDEENEYQT